jgi:phosphate transport system substrate-binding protein
MALVIGKSGKCSNFGNCSLADARTTVEVPSGLDFVCTECGKPLLLTEAGKAGGNSRMLLVVGVLLLIAVLAAGGVAWSLFKGKHTTETAQPPAAEVIVTPPSPSPAATEKPQPQPQPQPQLPAHGNCSEADAKAGLCRATR